MHVYADNASARHVNTVAGIEAPERYPAALAGVHLAANEGLPVEWRTCEPPPESFLAAVHELAYLRELQEVSAAGGGYLSADTGLNAHSWEAAARASGAAVGAVESALSGAPGFAAARPPGHHAGADYGMGFCLLNHAAVAAGHARSRGAERVAVLDWDVHHGNGTQDIFYADGRVLYLSVHQSPFYPGTGAAREVGEGAGRGLTANVPLPRGAGEEDYAAVFAGLFFPILREFRPEVLLVSAGYDAHAGDPIGGMRLEAESFGRFAAAVTALAREVDAAPPAFVLEGGYDLAALSESVAATLRGVCKQARPEWEYRGGNRAVEASRRALAPFWRSLR